MSPRKKNHHTQNAKQKSTTTTRHQKPIAPKVNYIEKHQPDCQILKSHPVGGGREAGAEVQADDMFSRNRTSLPYNDDQNRGIIFGLLFLIVILLFWMFLFATSIHIHAFVAGFSKCSLISLRLCSFGGISRFGKTVNGYCSSFMMSQSECINCA